MHQFNIGFCKDIVGCVKDAVLARGAAVNTNGQKALQRMTARLSAIPAFAQPDTRSESQTRYYRWFTGNIFNASHLTASEFRSQAFQLKYSLGEVADLFSKVQHKQIVDLLLCFEDFYLYVCTTDKFSTAELDKVEDKAARFHHQLMAAFGPDGSILQQSWLKPKLHALSHLRLWIRLYGNPKHYDSSSFELAHKNRTKDLAAKTCNRGDLAAGMLRRDVGDCMLEEVAAVAHLDDAGLDTQVRLQNCFDFSKCARWCIADNCTA